MQPRDKSKLEMLITKVSKSQRELYGKLVAKIRLLVLPFTEKFISSLGIFYTLFILKTQVKTRKIWYICLYIVSAEIDVTSVEAAAKKFASARNQ